ncbi:MAG: hypothetical protein QOD07_170 [Frankiaceae bacterium]|nr:hypothetical protein [Frankiaceae bacterium]
MTPTLAERWRISVIERAEAFQDQVERSLAQAGQSGPGVAHALELFAAYARALVRQTDVSWMDAPNDALRAAAMRALNEHLRARVDLYDTWFSRGHDVVPRALTSSVERDCTARGATDREAVLTLGPPGNYATFVADLREELFRFLQVDRDLRAPLDTLQLVLIGVPELEGTRALWQPVVSGHELAHYLHVLQDVFVAVGLDKALDRKRLSLTKGDLPAALADPSLRLRTLEQIAVRWLNELVCDAYAVHRYGPAGVAALTEFLASVGASSQIGPSHPPGVLRTELMFKWLGGRLNSVEQQIVSPLRNLGGTIAQPDWAVYLSEVLTGLAPAIKRAVAKWDEAPSYRAQRRTSVVDELAARFEMGIPGAEVVHVGGSAIAVDAADIVNAAWLATHRRVPKPINRFALKALDTVDFMHHWRDAGGDIAAGAMSGGTALNTRGALTEKAIRARVKSHSANRLVLTPLLAGSIRGASIDLRIGNKFILFERSTAAAFDPVDPAQDPRSMQTVVERAWGDVLYLHPGQLVLAATLEYIVLPADLTAQVITRSSYGRLGLISATAVQVHPNFAGCLTLELVNLGEMPMAITPGERVAQLMLFTTTNPVPPPVPGDEDKYRYPTGPEFSKVRDDAETESLRQMRRRFDSRLGRRSI